MRYSAVAVRYVKALLMVGIDNNKEGLYKDLLMMVTEVYRKFRDFFDDPTITAERKYKRMIQLLEDLNLELDEPFRNFLRVLFERKRQKYLELMVDLYERLEIEAKGKILAEVIAPYDLSDDEWEYLRKFVKKHAFREPVFKSKIDDSLIAGVKVEFEGLSYDISVSGRLKRIYRDVFGKGVM